MRRAVLPDVDIMRTHTRALSRPAPTFFPAACPPARRHPRHCPVVLPAARCRGVASWGRFSVPAGTPGQWRGRFLPVIDRTPEPAQGRMGPLPTHRWRDSCGSSGLRFSGYELFGIVLFRGYPFRVTPWHVLGCSV